MNLNLGLTQKVIEAAKEKGILRNQLAYILATAYWESGRTMRPVREYGGEQYLKRKRYYPYVGMGLVQLTWKTNYRRASKKLGVDFVSNPRLLLNDKHSVEILVIGMVEGWFTGKSLSDYITLQKSDFVGARRIINGVDKKIEIAQIAKDYDKELLNSGYGVVVGSLHNDGITEIAKDAAAIGRVSTTEIASGVTGFSSIVAVGNQALQAAETATSLKDVALQSGPWVILALIGAYAAYHIYRERRRKKIAARKELP